jgi:hypothetical protein
LLPKKKVLFSTDLNERVNWDENTTKVDIPHNTYSDFWTG